MSDQFLMANGVSCADNTAFLGIYLMPDKLPFGGYGGGFGETQPNDGDLLEDKGVLEKRSNFNAVPSHHEGYRQGVVGLDTVVSEAGFHGGKDKKWGCVAVEIF